MAPLLSQVQRFKARTAPLMPHPTHTVAKSASRSLYAGLAPGRALKSLTDGGIVLLARCVGQDESQLEDGARGMHSGGTHVTHVRIIGFMS